MWKMKIDEQNYSDVAINYADDSIIVAKNIEVQTHFLGHQKVHYLWEIPIARKHVRYQQ